MTRHPRLILAPVLVWFAAVFFATTRADAQSLAPVQITTRSEPAPSPGEYFEEMPARRPRRETSPYRGGALRPGSWLETLGVGWLASTVGFFASISCGSGWGGVSCRSGSAALIIPAIGPWLALADSRDSTLSAVLVADGFAQGLGIALLVAGNFVRHTVVVTEVEARLAPARRNAVSRTFALAPGLGGTSLGISAVGTF